MTCPTSFPEIYHDQFEYAWACLRRLGVPPAAQEDALQELFLVVHRRLPEFAGRSSLKTWIFGVARRVAARHRRTEARRTRRHARLAAVTAAEPLACDDDELARRDARRRLAEFLDRLDDDRRAVFVLHLYEEMPAPEIARTLNLNVNTVYSRIRLAREQLERTFRDPAALPTATAPEVPPDGAQQRVWAALLLVLGGAAATTAPAAGVAHGVAAAAGSNTLPWALGLGAAAIAVVVAAAPDADATRTGRSHAPIVAAAEAKAGSADTPPSADTASHESPDDPPIADATHCDSPDDPPLTGTSLCDSPNSQPKAGTARCEPIAGATGCPADPPDASTDSCDSLAGATGCLADPAKADSCDSLAGATGCPADPAKAARCDSTAGATGCRVDPPQAGTARCDSLDSPSIAGATGCPADDPPEAGAASHDSPDPQSIASAAHRSADAQSTPRNGRTTSGSRGADSARLDLDADRLALEAALIADVHASIDAGRTDDALARLARHRKEFPDGALQPERFGLRAVALCRAGRVREGLLEARAFLRQHPDSALAARVRHDCDLTGGAEPPADASALARP